MSRSFLPLSSDKPLGGRYQVIKELGVGGFGRTFLAEDLHLPGHPRCVIKHLKPQIKSEDTLLMARRCFNTEAQVLYRLGVHDQIPRLLAHLEEDQEFYLALEFVEGEPLTQELVEGKPWSQGRTVRLMQSILDVLAFVHQQQVIHRDLKPSNLIRRGQDGRIVLIDFGAVKQVSTQSSDAATGLTNMTISIGTQGYMPNEQLAGKPRYSSDVYAVGMLGIQALTGIHPRHLGEDDSGEVAWHEQALQVMPDLKSYLDRMVRYDFRERYSTAVEALHVLEQLPAAIWEDLTDPTPPTVTILSKSSQSDASSQPTPVHAAGSGSTLNPDLEWIDAGEPIPEEALLPTAIWTPTEAIEPTVGSTSTGLTQAIGRPHAPMGATAVAVSPTANPLRRLTHPAVWLGLVAAIGVLLAAVQSVFPQLSALVVNRPINSSGASLTASPTPTPIPTPASTDPKQQATLLLKQASQLQSNGNYAEALATYDRALQLTPDDAATYAGRCEILNLLKRPEEAIVSCNDALAYKPNQPQALWSKGNALLQLGRIYEALKLYEEVTYLQPDSSPGWVRRGVALQRLGRSAEALVALDHSISLRRNVFEAWMTRGQALMNLQRYDEAIVSFDKALQLQPNHDQTKRLRQEARNRTGSR